MLTTDNVTGAPTWLELGSPDVAVSIDFYGELFGWRHHSAGPDTGGYGLFTLDGRTVAALSPLGGQQRLASWNISFHTPDVDAAVVRALAAGGTLVTPPENVDTAGRLAALTDPTGAGFSLWQPGDTTGLELVNEPGSLVWTELYTTDARVAREFYRETLGWVEVPGTASGPPTPEEGYTLLATEGGTRPAHAHAGLLQLAEADLAAGSWSEWHPYIAVVDCDATLHHAIKNGASALFPPTELEGTGRLAMFADPNGAPCAVLAGSVDGTH